MWSTVIAPFQSKISSHGKFKEMKPVIQETERKLKQLLDSDDVFHEFAVLGDAETALSEDSRTAIAGICLRWGSASDSIRKTLTEWAKYGLARAFDKFMSDMSMTKDFDPETAYPMTNRLDTET